MSKIIALFNQSGGVSKTSLTMNLGYHLAKRKQKVLLVDMDPQASLTAFMGLEPSELQETVYESIMNGSDAALRKNLHQRTGSEARPYRTALILFIFC